MSHHATLARIASTSMTSSSTSSSVARTRNPSRTLTVSRRASRGANVKRSASPFDAANMFMYDATSALDVAIGADTLGQGHVGVTTYATVLFAGVFTSLSPCTLSVLPLTIGYIGGYGDATADRETRVRTASVAFAFGLASTLAGLGASAAAFGAAYGQGVGDGLPTCAAALAVVMGLNLLNVIDVSFPSFGANFDPKTIRVPAYAQAYLAGAVFALAASPCATPILATLLAYAASSGDPASGSALLLTYTSGYVAPLLFAATATDGLKNVMALREKSAWVNPTSGFLLVAGGTYAFLSRVAPHLTLA